MTALEQTQDRRSRRLRLARSWVRRAVMRGRMPMPAFRARRLAMVMCVVLAMMVGVAPAALAYWHSAGAGAGTGTAGTLAAPSTVVVASAGATVTVDWVGVTPPGGTLDGYTVIRYAGATPSNACGTDPANSATFIPAGTVTCDDLSVPDGTYTYTVTAVWRSWTTGSVNSSTVTVTSVVAGPLKWFGDGQYGQGGVADFIAERSPGQESTAATSWTAVVSGGSHGCGTRTGGTLWCWGLNSNGQLGDGSTTQRADPTQVAGTSWATVSAGTSHTCATKTNSTLWCWGLNTSGRLGDGTQTQRLVPTQVGVLTNWATVSAGSQHSCATKTGGGALWCWGYNLSAQLGIGNQVSPQISPVQVGTATTWASVSAGGNHSCGTQLNAGNTTVWCWGNNTNGQIGLGTVGSPQITPAQVGVLTTWASVTTGTSHTCARKGIDSTLWCWGLNTNGRLGDSTTTQRPSPTQVGVLTSWASVSAGGSHTCATRNGGGTAWCWGLNTSGQLGDGTISQRTSPAQVGVLATWTAVSAGTSQTCATKAGTLWCWGLGTNGQLGNGAPRATSTAIQVGTATTWTSVAAGSYHTCAVRADNTLWCWGTNAKGQLGLGNTTIQYRPTQVPGTIWSTVGVGWEHTCATRTDGTLWCWGANTTGQVGNGGVVSPQLSPVQVSVGVTTWDSVAGGQVHTCATRTDGTLWCWGNNQFGQIGNGGVVTPQMSPVQVSVGVTTWNTVTAGQNHTCATRTDGTLWCWGYNGEGNIGNGGIVSPQMSPVQVSVGVTTWDSVSAGAAHNCATRTDGTLWCWGYNTDGQVGNGGIVSPQTSPVQVSVGVTTWAMVAGGFTHTCATRTDNSLWCWGYNLFGQLGLGDITSRSSPTQVPGVTVTGGVYAGFQSNQTFVI